MENQVHTIELTASEIKTLVRVLRFVADMYRNQVTMLEKLDLQENSLDFKEKAKHFSALANKMETDANGI